ncbi:MAG: COX15/CtaA family protein [Methylophilus sp.]|nr:COX15/CtaA family protein [Methylophilus sp.]
MMFKRLCLIAMITAICVVVLGAYVRLSDAGLGCPDWPGCYGTLTVPESESAIQKAQTIYPNNHIEAGKAWKEMIHRYLAGLLGLMVLALFVLGWKHAKEIKVNPWLTTVLVGIVMFQAMLGMWTVTMLLKPAIVSAHLLGGMSTLAILVWIAHRHWGLHLNYHSINRQFYWMVRVGLLVLFTQIFLGGWTSTNYAALACTDFPTCHGVLMPEMNFKDAFHMLRELGQNADGTNLTLASLTAIQWTHRIGAVITLIYLGFIAINGLKYVQLRMLSIALLLALIAQVSLGIANLLLHLPLVLAVAHNFGAALLVVVMVLFNSKITSSQSR